MSFPALPPKNNELPRPVEFETKTCPKDPPKEGTCDAVGRYRDFREDHVGTKFDGLIGDARRPARARDFALTATPELRACCEQLELDLAGDSKGAYLRAGGLDRALANAAKIADPVQRDLITRAIDLARATGTVDGDKLRLKNPTIANILTSGFQDSFEVRTKAILEHPALKALEQEPGRAAEAGQLAEFLVRYTNDPVLRATVDTHASPRGFIFNAGQFWHSLVGDRKLYDVDGWIGQCNETQQLTRQVFEQFEKSILDRHGAGALRLGGAEVTESSTAYYPELRLDAEAWTRPHQADQHMLFAVGPKGTAPSIFVDPWLFQTNDPESVMTKDQYRSTRDGLTDLVKHRYQLDPVK